MPMAMPMPVPMPMTIGVSLGIDDAAHHPAWNAGLRVGDDDGAAWGGEAFNGAAAVVWIEEVGE